MKSFAPLLLALGVITHGLHRSLDTVVLPQPANLRETLPSEEALRLLSAGYPSLVADFYWLRAIAHFGDDAMEQHAYPNLEPLVRRVLALDPYFGAGYFFAGTALTVQGLDPHASVELLEQGMRYRPDLWYIPFLLGFNLYYFEGQYLRAAQALAKAAEFADAPPIAGPLAARLAAEAGAPDVGMQLVDSLLAHIQDPKLQETYVQRRRQLQLEQELGWLNQAVDAYRAQIGHAPNTLADLVTAGVLREVPAEPLGGRYELGADGVVTSTSPRLRLPSAAKQPIQTWDPHDTHHGGH